MLHHLTCSAECRNPASHVQAHSANYACRSSLTGHPAAALQCLQIVLYIGPKEETDIVAVSARCISHERQMKRTKTTREDLRPIAPFRAQQYRVVGRHGPLPSIYTEHQDRKNSVARKTRISLSRMESAWRYHGTYQTDGGAKKTSSTNLRFYDLQVPHLDPTRREIRYFELHTDRPLALTSLSSATHAASKPSSHAASVLIIPFYGRQAKLCAHEEFFTSAELLDLPYYGALLGRVMYAADIGAKAWGVSVFGDGHENFDVVGRGAAFELRPSLCERYVSSWCIEVPTR